MRPFAPCPECAAEYADPADRRFHSADQLLRAVRPRAPVLRRDGTRLAGDPIAAAVAALARGKVAAIHGIGGFHLAADPRAEGAMKRLRREKERERKPFALMVRDLDEARALCALSKAEEELLASPAAPILIALETGIGTGLDGDGVRHGHSRADAALHPPAPAPVPASPADIPWLSLVMTSGNRADEPIITDPAQPAEARRCRRRVPLPRQADRFPH